MNLLITGGSGFVGQDLLNVLSARGHKGLVSGRTLPPVPHGDWRGCAREQLLGGNFPGNWNSRPPETVIHLEVDQRASKPSHSWKECGLNRVLEKSVFTATAEWLAWAERHHVGQFCFISSAMAVRPNPGPNAEDATRTPVTPYGKEKARAEKAVEAWARGRADRRAVILRPVPAYGPDPRSNLLSFACLVASGKPCLVGSGEAIMSVVSRRNLSAAIAWAVEQNAAGCHLFNVTDNEELSVRKLATVLAEAAGAPSPRALPRWLASIAARIGDATAWATGTPMPFSTRRLEVLEPNSWFSCQKLKDAGFIHPQTTHEGLRQMMKWWIDSHA